MFNHLGNLAAKRCMEVDSNTVVITVDNELTGCTNANDPHDNSAEFEPVLREKILEIIYFYFLYSLKLYVKSKIIILVEKEELSFIWSMLSHTTT